MKYPKEHLIIKPTEYVSSNDTDISKTFKRIKAELAKIEKEKVNTHNVRVIKSKHK